MGETLAMKAWNFTKNGILKEEMSPSSVMATPSLAFCKGGRLEGL